MNVQQSAIEASLDYIENNGGINKYLEDSGVSKEDQNLIHDLLAIG